MGSSSSSRIKKAHDDLGLFFLHCSKKKINSRDIDIIALHGQTISHIDRKSTKQIGDPKYLAEYFKVPIIYDFRSKDILLEGTGAPLMPFLDWLLYKNININTFANINTVKKVCSTTSSVVLFDLIIA